MRCEVTEGHAAINEALGIAVIFPLIPRGGILQIISMRSLGERFKIIKGQEFIGRKRSAYKHFISARRAHQRRIVQNPLFFSLAHRVELRQVQPSIQLIQPDNFVAQRVADRRDLTRVGQFFQRLNQLRNQIGRLVVRQIRVSAAVFVICNRTAVNTRLPRI